MSMDDYFTNLNDRERAIFEGAVSMGALYHQFVGTPVNMDTKKSLEDAIKSSIKLQPAVVDVCVNLDEKLIADATKRSSYTSVTGDMFNVEITTKINDTSIITCIKYIEDLDYPLMFVKE
ncbi:dihydroneopterin aldolase family protein [Methanosphaera cuniculi]|uniref:Dihydroneopterin aldolase n=1 Tax=Methanosphaera cuniculi TaxID=1077256 RepID=A0A2A2HCH0_9EURY|nr:dihydroneopterin aldolase family protein [Methanosphaera cuniculi]PAV07119.1 dihydroneopterin aldolase [Methanosphaera cuniculi]PWL09046.1 hypothetical protein MSCUN_00140 [Methanosphaera cuniculi]